MGTTSQKLEYLNGTKGKLKQAINNIGGSIDSNTTFRNYATQLDTIYTNLPKVSDTGTSVSLSPTLKGRLGITPQGNTYQETTLGTNYFNADAIANTNIVVSDNGKTITMPLISSGNGITSTSKKLSELCPELSVGDVVYLRATTTSSANTYIYLNISDYLWYFGGSRTITQNDLNSIVNLYGNRYSSGETNQVVISDLRIVKNASDSWEKFTFGASPNPSYPQEIQSATGTQTITVSGKNVNNGVMELGTITGTTGENNTSTNRIRTSGYVLVNNSTQYTLSAKNINTSKTMQGFIFEYDKDNTFIQRIPSDWQQLPITFTTSSSAKKIRILLSYTDTSATNVSDFYDIQIEKGSTPTSYQPYITPVEKTVNLGNIELNEIGTYKDYISGTPDNLVYHKNVGKTTVTGTVSSITVRTNSVRIFINGTINNVINGDNYNKLYSSHFQGKNVYSNDVVGIMTGYNTGSNFGFMVVGVPLEAGSTSSAIETYLTNLNASLLYPLRAEETETITDTNLISQLNDLYYTYSYDDTTNIDVTGNLPIKITASAIKGE